MSMTAKERAAQAAFDFVADGMTLGLGTGSTAKHFIDMVGAKVAQGWEIQAIPTSEASATQAMALGITLIEPDETTLIDVAVDGADEADADGALIKGGGGALLREKIIAQAAKKFVVIADASKDVGELGAFPLPIEIDRFGWSLTVTGIRQVLADLGYGTPDLQLRSAASGGAFLSDGGNYVLDVKLERIVDAGLLDGTLTMLPGVVTTGLFVGLADTLIFGTETGVDVRHV